MIKYGHLFNTLDDLTCNFELLMLTNDIFTVSAIIIIWYEIIWNFH